MRERTIASHFVRAALRGPERHGLDCAAILRHAGIQAALLEEPVPGSPRSSSAG